jgi:hypothetical protein
MARSVAALAGSGIREIETTVDDDPARGVQIGMQFGGVDERAQHAIVL